MKVIFVFTIWEQFILSELVGQTLSHLSVFLWLTLKLPFVSLAAELVGKQLPGSRWPGLQPQGRRTGQMGAVERQVLWCQQKVKQLFQFVRGCVDLSPEFIQRQNPNISSSYTHFPPPDSGSVLRHSKLFLQLHLGCTLLIPFLQPPPALQL